MRRFIGLALFVALALSPAIASADYICDARLLPGSSSFGTLGSVYIAMMTGPDCTGSLVGHYYLCSTNATDSACSSSAMDLFKSREQLAAIFTPIAQAASENHPVIMITGSCIGGAGGCARLLSFK